MKLKVFTYKGGKKAYAMGNVEVQVNKEKPQQVESVEVDEESFDDFFKNPKGREIEIKKGKARTVKRKKTKPPKKPER